MTRPRSSTADGVLLGREAAFFFFAAGWAAAKATTIPQRALVTAVLVIGVPGYFGSTARETLVLAGFALLIWLPAVRCPAALSVVAGVLAEASLYTYLTHYQIYPLFGGHRLAGVIASIAVGVALTTAVSLLRRQFRERTLSPRDFVQVPALR